jgi:hypothetical protein
LLVAFELAASSKNKPYSSTASAHSPHWPNIDVNTFSESQFLGLYTGITGLQIVQKNLVPSTPRCWETPICIWDNKYHQLGILSSQSEGYNVLMVVS